MSTNLANVLSFMNGAAFIGFDSETVEVLTGGKSNPMQGRVTKRGTGHSVMVFQNKLANGYLNQKRKLLEAAGQNPDDFKLSPRAWGERLPNTPIVRNVDKKTGQRKYYLEVIFLRAGKTEYFLDGVAIDKEDIIGLKPAGPKDETAVPIRTFAMDSLRAIRCDKQEFTAPFEYDADVAIGALVRPAA
jgi:hypothetical protein